MRPLAALAAACLIGSLAVVAPHSAQTAEAAPAKVTAKTLLAKLPVRAESRSKKFDRNRFGYDQGLDADGDGCSTRKEVLIRDAISIKKISSSCAVYGKWKSPYDGRVTTNPNALEVDHLVPLAEAWSSGASKWPKKKLIAFGNDLGYKWDLQAVTKSANQGKKADEPAVWLPKKNRCTYVAAWVGVKYRWKLSVDKREKTFLSHYLAKCDGVKVQKPGTPNLTALVNRAAPVATAPTTAPVAAAPAPAAPVTAPVVPAPVFSPAPVPVAAPTCPSGNVFGEITSIVPNTTKSSSYYEYFNATGYVRNDSAVAVDVSSISPSIDFYSAAGAKVDYTYGDWDLSNYALTSSGGFTLPPGATLAWRKTDGIMDKSDWLLSAIAIGSATSPFSVDWTDPKVSYDCPSPVQPSSTRTQYTITH